ncbi:GTP cyclohydrolase I FolE [Paraburkholderia sp. UCT31]|uniref:GTP cyclohydrolase I FolE n=1 Tax=Paraburkholderia sp. UCT31 TaxID=2615209 RepID=UPI0016556680|nr:GTP cyclohydrolase I FolE [Paraburkholderia sp. UCT31]MBC8741839.1 GTP cyclohydrolase I FolE [Paraburkholderia sp. UCT31]
MHDLTDEELTIGFKLLQSINGENAAREGLAETPGRYMKALKGWTAGYAQDPIAVLKTFDDGAKDSNDIILLTDIPLYSMCEHHLATIFGVAHIGYIPNGRIVGLSKMSRVVDIFAKRLQVQERLTNQIADAIIEGLDAKGVAVVLDCRHMCMESRGINKPGITTRTTARRGVLTDPEMYRHEFLPQIPRSVTV